MANLFGFFNFDKEGPGIPKNAPKKKTFVVFFETFFRNFWKFIPINFFYCLISAPIITNGFANVGITNVTRNTARDKHSFGLSDFFETIRKNLKQAMIVGVLNVIIYALLAFDVYFFYSADGTIGIIGTGLNLSLLMIFTMMNYYIWTLLITFNYTTKQVYLNGFKLVFLNFKFSLLCFIIKFLILAFAVALIFVLPKFSFYILLIEVLIAILVYPAFSALLTQFCIFPSIKKFIIDPYYREHPNEDIEKRRNLGLEIEEDKKTQQSEDGEIEEDDSIIFND